MIGIEVYEMTRSSVKISRLNESSLKLLDEILDIVSVIEVKDDDNRVSLWVTADRGTFSDFKKSKYYDDDINTKKEFLRFFPDDKFWLEFFVANNKYVKMLCLNNWTIEIMQDDKYVQDSFCYDLVELLTWIKETVKDVVEEIRDGKYNERVERELPYEYRYGTIPRKVYWDNLPELREEMYKGVSEEEKQRVLNILEKEGSNYIPEKRIKGMTFNKYFEMVCPCYKALGKPVDESPSKAFLCYADDFGGGVLRERIDYNSVQDFEDYYDNKINGMCGGHPWGIIRGSSRTRIMLYPERTENGYYFLFSGNPNWSIVEIIKCYLTLKDMGVPVMFSFPKETIEYIKEEDLIGFVSHKDFPAYCQLSFPNIDVNDFRHYDEKLHFKIFGLINWLKEEEVKLKK